MIHWPGGLPDRETCDDDGTPPDGGRVVFFRKLTVSEEGIVRIKFVVKKQNDVLSPGGGEGKNVH